MSILSEALMAVARRAQRNKKAVVTAAIAGALVYPAARPIADLATSVVEALSTYATGSSKSRANASSEGGV